MKFKLRYSLLVLLEITACQNFSTQEKLSLASSSAQEPKEHKEDHMQNKQVPQKLSEKYTHTVSIETPYYLEGPQQGTPPDGSFSAGTKLKLLQNMGSYSLVLAGDNLRAYLSNATLKKL